MDLNLPFPSNAIMEAPGGVFIAADSVPEEEIFP
jgi:hypothetical protein